MTNKHKKGRSKKQSPRKAAGSPAKTNGVNLVTGKATTEYYFDPALVLPKNPDSKLLPTPEQVLASRHLFMPCTIIKPLEGDATKDAQPFAGPTLVKTTPDGTLHKISDSSQLIRLRSPDDYLGVDDVLFLPQISEASLLHTLRTRYQRDEIYTAAGPILIAINPYKAIQMEGGESIYSVGTMLQYRLERTDPKPHLFQIANRAYTALMDSVHVSRDVNHLEDNGEAVFLTSQSYSPGTARDQSIIISGESGAGKTEATKIIMQFLARITRQADAQGTTAATLEDRVLSSNPLLESFGNAQTLRNDNSSRFGKFIHIYFDTQKGGITGASISNYLLEKTRVTTQVEGERNYHIFYQLLSDAELCRELGLEAGAAGFSYLRPSKDQGDAASFVETKECLERIGLTEDETKSVFKMAAAVLHLGNIQFETRGDDEEGFENQADCAKIAEGGHASLEKACELLGLDKDQLEEAILTKTLVINGKTIKKSQNESLAADKRDALAKMTYSRLFLWLVKRVNETLSQASVENRSGVGYIGVLDIYGFECFEDNGLEQLLINYCNEKLQRHFNRHLFEVEQELYANEGVDWSYITFNDNRPCLELIEGGGGTIGVLNALDDAWGAMGAATEKDGKFVTQLHKLFGSAVEGKQTANGDSDRGGHQNFITPKFGKEKQFIIVHYAGEVKYTADGFVEKNMETLSNEMKELGESSSIDFSKDVYSCDPSSSGGKEQRSSLRGVSVGSQFRSNLQTLVDELDRTQPHYIRCVKPNGMKAPAAFVPGDVLKQLRYSGMMEAIRIRREGYALREDHDVFFERFSVLLNSDELNEDEDGIEQLVKVLSKRLGVTDADWQIGHAKIFLRRELSDKLERLAKLRVQSAARTLGRFGSHSVARRLSRFVAAWARFRMHMKLVKRKDLAATKIASVVRRHRGVASFRYARSAATLIQARCRVIVAQQQVRLIRDPYCEMDFRECKRLLREKSEELDKAVANKDFQSASRLEKEIATLKLATNAKRPLTRAVLDEQICEVQRSLDDAVSRKAFAECGPLQIKLEELSAKRAELPSIDELRQFVVDAEEAVARAAKNRDFAEAATAQVAVVDAKKKLADALAAQDEDEEVDSDDKENSMFGFDSRAQLEADLVEIGLQIKQAIDDKDFKKASLLQKMYEERESLRKLFPTADELEGQLLSLRKDLGVAIQAKNFAKASKLDEDVAQLEEKIASERQRMNELRVVDASPKAVFVARDGATTIFESRPELERFIKELSMQVSQAVKAKRFKDADSIQADVDKLVRLRDALPSVPEIRRQLEEKRMAMQKAIDEKRFGEAEGLSVAVEGLEAKLALEATPSPVIQPKPKESLHVSTTPPMKPLALQPSSSKEVIAINGGAPPPSAASTALKMKKKKTQIVSPSMGISVAKLRPAKAIATGLGDSVLSVAQLLASKRSGAAVIVGPSGELAGILTDTDVTRRVVAKSLDPGSTLLSNVMTPDPHFVSMQGSAMESLMTMVENRFRHLPVVENDGSVVGVLDIARCLHNAIDKLERSSEKSSKAAEVAVLQAVSQQGASTQQAAALQALLSGLLSKALGNRSMPTLRSLLAGRRSAIVEPTTSIRATAGAMAESRKAALVVEDGKLVGIFGFKDMMTRAVAKEVNLDVEHVASVMTPSPEYVTPDITVLEALQTMHDNGFLNLPVCEEDGSVVGLVGVMDVIHGCGGVDGWRSVFMSSLEVQDDTTDSGSQFAAGNSVLRTPPFGDQVEENDRPVSRLRPSKPILSHYSDSVTKVAQILTKRRGAASLVVDESGMLAGIITDTDITRRVVAKKLLPDKTSAKKAMTPKPTCVKMSDSAMDALSTMVENHFRHLPVVDSTGAVVGLLDIAKCLNDAISKLEKAESRSRDATESVVKEIVNQHAGAGANTEAIQALLGGLMNKAFGQKSAPTLGTILNDKEVSIVEADDSVRTAAAVMAKQKKAVLVVDKNDQLVGIFGFKDMMTRVVAKELDLDKTRVGSVMTPSPEWVSSETTLLEALHSMHDNRFMNLAVCEEDGTVLGVVNVMDVIYGFGGADGWRSMFENAMDMTDDQSETMSVHSHGYSVESAKTGNGTGNAGKKVEKLRPSKPHLATSTETVVEVCQALQRKRGSSAVVVDEYGGLAGIVTDTDITRRIVARGVDPYDTPIAGAMTHNPTCVASDDSAMDALTVMVENNFRHLPVVNDIGTVVGVLDIAKCLNDAIDKLERAADTSSSSDAIRQMVEGAAPANAAALEALLGSVLKEAFGARSLPSLRSLIAGKAFPMVSPEHSIREAAVSMSKYGKPALVVDQGSLLGIFGFKDLMSRAVADELDFDTTPVSRVMTKNPETVLPDLTVLEALQSMHDNRFLNLPVCEADGTVLGIVGVMDVIHGCGGAKGWRSIFSNAMALDDASEGPSMQRSKAASQSRGPPSATIKALPDTPFVSKIPASIPKTLEFTDDQDNASLVGSTIGDERGMSTLMSPDVTSGLSLTVGVFKVVDPTGHTHRVRCELHISELLADVASKIDIPTSRIQLQYIDEEGDVVLLNEDEDVEEAWKLALKQGNKVAKLTAKKTQMKPAQTMVFAGAVGVALLVACAGAFVLLRPKRG